MFLEKSFIYVFFPKTTSTVTHQRQRDGKRQRKASSRQSCFLGLEMRPELVWEDWDLRREFTKTLVLKNIHNKLRKLHVRFLQTHIDTCIHIFNLTLSHKKTHKL